MACHGNALQCRPTTLFDTTTANMLCAGAPCPVLCVQGMAGHTLVLLHHAQQAAAARQQNQQQNQQQQQQNQQQQQQQQHCHHANTASAAAARADLGHALAVIVWALVKLRWTPSGAEAGGLLALLAAQLQLAPPRPREAALMLWSLGQLRLRPSASLMTALLTCCTGGSLGQGQGQQQQSFSAVCDAVQALQGCRALGWRPGAAWWRRVYSETLPLLGCGSCCAAAGDDCAAQTSAAAAAALRSLLAHAAASGAPRPTPAWWRAAWVDAGAALEGTLHAQGLSRAGQLASGPGARASLGLASAVLRSAREAVKAEARAAAVCDAASRGLAAFQALRAYAHTLSLLRAAVATTAAEGGGQRSSILHASPPKPPTGAADRGSQQQLHGGDVARLLWASARLGLLPPQRALWALLLLAVLHAGSCSPPQLTAMLWAAAQLCEQHGHTVVQRHMLLALLAVAAQQRLHALSATIGSSADVARLRSALRYFAARARLRDLLLPGLARPPLS
jgi:hypothetical protein